MLAVLAVSAEGLYMAWILIGRGRSLTFLKYYNIDAITAWRFNGLRVDSLVRSMWYNPHHSMSAALALVAMPVAGAAGVAAPLGAIALAGLVLALSTTFNPLVGGLFSVIYAGVIVADSVQAGQLRLLLRHAIAATAVVAAVAWCITNDMVEGAAGVVIYGFGGLARNAPIAATALSLGLLMIPAVLALWPPAKLARYTWPSVAGMIIGLLVFFLVRISRDAPYIGFRAGQLLQITLPGLAAVFFARVARLSRALATAAATLLIVTGLPTSLIDIFNAQDIDNHEMGPGFRWTIMLSPEEQQAYRWMRTQTPPKAVVAMDPYAHGRETWSQLPTFAWRRMAGGKPISLMAVPDYEIRSRLAQAIYSDLQPRWRGTHCTAARPFVYLRRSGRGTSPPARGTGETGSPARSLQAGVLEFPHADLRNRSAPVILFSGVVVPVSIVAICTGIVAVIIAGPWALAYILLYFLATLPGWPLGRVLFGRHPAGWVFGGLLGYGLTCFAWWAVIELHVPSAAAFVLAWAIVSAATWSAFAIRLLPPSRSASGTRRSLWRRRSRDSRSLHCRPGARPTRARSCCFCCSYRLYSSFRTRISARVMLKAIVSIERTSPQISSGTWR